MVPAVVDDGLQSVQSPCGFNSTGEGAGEMVVHGVRMIADTIEQRMSLLEPPQVDQATGEAADRPIVVRLGLQPRPDSRRRLREVDARRFFLAPHLAGLSGEHQRMIVVRLQRGGALQHRRGKGGIELGEASAAEQIVDVARPRLQRDRRPEALKRARIVAADRVDKAFRRVRLGEPRVASPRRLAMAHGFVEIGRFRAIVEAEEGQSLGAPDVRRCEGRVGGGDIAEQNDGLRGIASSTVVGQVAGVEVAGI